MSFPSGFPIALTMGDPAGVGPEITHKAWQSLRSENNHTFFVMGNPAFYPEAQTIASPDQAGAIFSDVLPVMPIDCKTPVPGKPDEGVAPAVIRSIDGCVDLALANKIAAVVTNPISKDVLYRAGFKHPGHTEYLASITSNYPLPYGRGPMMMLSAKDLRVALVTIHTPLRSVPAAISETKIVEAATILHGALKTDFGIDNPRIAMAGLNPHAGENGSIGSEEIELINPAAEKLRKAGIDITDARSADTLFHEEARQQYDAALCMYHDQGLIPVKTLDFHGGVNTTLGLPIVRTSPDHGTAFDIAGQDVARPESLIQAIQLARSIADQRARSN